MFGLKVSRSSAMQGTNRAAATEPQAFQQMQPQLAAENIVHAMQQLQKELQQHQLSSKSIKGLESKLSTLEASVLATGKPGHATLQLTLFCASGQSPSTPLLPSRR